MPLRSEGERKDTADTQIIVPHLFFLLKKPICENAQFRKVQMGFWML